MKHSSVVIDCAGTRLLGDLELPRDAEALVVFVPGDETRLDALARLEMAAALHEGKVATLQLETLGSRPQVGDPPPASTEEMTRWTLAVLDWASQTPSVHDLALGLYARGLAVPAALTVAAERPERVRALVAVSGRPDQATRPLTSVTAYTLFVVGGQDHERLHPNLRAAQQLPTASMSIVREAGPQLEEPGALQEMQHLACYWLRRNLDPPPAGAGTPAPVPLPFADRRQAAVQLARHLAHHRERPDVVVLGLPRGGALLAEVVARELSAPADLLDLRAAEREPPVGEARHHPDATGRTVILVDDGMATGATMRAAVAWTQAQHAAWTVVAVPVASLEAAILLATLADELVCLATPEPFAGVGACYVDPGEVAAFALR